jgi:alkylation response protein AidB-like acyl-CoA dehydrogenase
MWITNAAFADIFVTFAQVDGNQFSCFIVEKDFPGVSTGAEEHKMGLKGSSTRPLILDNARVPLENLVGEVGKGHHVAFNILNIGRAKLGAISAGAGKTAFNDALRYARQRIAFGKPISSFGAIQHKLAEMAIRNWVVEGMVYRTAAMIDRKLAAAAPGDRLQELAAIREYAVECSILKVFGSEALDFVVDEAVQIYGGYGYSAEYPVERYYRDARVNRIFEGTNEINRLLISGMLLKQKVYLSNVDASSPLAGAKKAFQLLAALADETYKDTVKEQQEILMLLSDMAMAIYAMDTALCRSEKQASAEIPRLMTDVFVDDAMEHMRSCAKQITAAIHEVPNLDRLLEWVRINTIKARRRIAEYLTEN